MPQISRLLWGGVLGFFCCVSYFYVLMGFHGGKEDCATAPSDEDLSNAPLPWARRGLFSLAPTALQDNLGLSRSLHLLAQNTRPDAATCALQLLIGLEGFPSTRYLAQGEQVFLRGHAVDDRIAQDPLSLSPLAMSTQPTPLYLSPIICQRYKDRILFELCWQKESGEKVEEIVCLPPPPPFGARLLHAPWAKALRQGQYWEGDALYSLYGADARPAEMLRLHIDGSVICAKSGDFLRYREERWQKCILSSANDLPLAYIHGVHNGLLELKLWDATGFYSEKILLPSSMVQLDGVGEALEKVFVSPRLRGASSVSCVVGKRRVTLAPGDWWLHTERGWHNLKRIQEIEEYLAFQLQGSLFVIDAVEKMQTGALLRGHLFDRMRREARPVSFAIADLKRVPPQVRPSAPAPQSTSARSRRTIDVKHRRSGS